MIRRRWMVVELRGDRKARQVEAFTLRRSARRERDRRNAGFPSRPAGAVYTIRRKH